LVNHDAAVAPRSILTGSGDALLDHAATKVCADQASLGTLNRFSEHLCGQSARTNCSERLSTATLSPAYLKKTQSVMHCHRLSEPACDRVANRVRMKKHSAQPR
jgi:hypothetical protein